MPGWLETRRKAKEAARQRAIAADNDANDRIAYGFVPARHDDRATPAAPAPTLPRPTQPDPPAPAPRPAVPADSNNPGPDFRPAGSAAEEQPPAETQFPAYPPDRPIPPARPEPQQAAAAGRAAETAPAPRAELSPDQAVDELLGINGALAAAVVAGDSGEVLAESAGPGFDLTIAAAGAVELLRTQRRLLAEAGDDATINDLQVTLSSRYELTSAATSERAEGLVLYLALNRETANLAIARRRLTSVSAALVG